jgi:hypothetical protein
VLPLCNWLAPRAELFPPEALAPWIAEADVLELACAPEWSAETDALCEAATLVWVFAEVCAKHKPDSRNPEQIETAILFMGSSLTGKKGMQGAGQI